MRVILDTNVVLSGLMYPASVPGQILKACLDGRLEWVLTRELLDEFESALTYPQIQKRLPWNSEERQRYLDLVKIQVVMVNAKAGSGPKPSDKDDSIVIDAWRGARADWVLTGDKALQQLAKDYPIVSPAEFWKRFGDLDIGS